MSAGDHPLRQALWPLGLLYGAVAGFRNFLFDSGGKAVHRLDVPVVSIGNLTVGGTGKTPTVAWLCRQAAAAGKRPGVLARGYGRAPGAELNDEGELLRRRMPELLQQQDPDRVAAGRRLVAAGADYIVLDDGFQHRRLHRDLDVVCLDAKLPFGNGQCLPAGDLREFRSGVRRAGKLLLTRAEGLEAEQLVQRAARLRQLARRDDLRVHACTHAPSELVEWSDLGAGEPVTHEVATLAGQRVVLLSAIARPESLRDTVVALGAEVVRELRYRDHHRYTLAEARAAVEAAMAAEAMLVTTEKDDVKLAALVRDGDAELPRHVLRIDLQFLEHMLDGEPRPAEFLL
ncbi:MAG: tetraacyldisaccharide 4'-kinase [bacterium]|nr:tetraacyldisaccharide 4'-kinase [bacterium]